MKINYIKYHNYRCFLDAKVSFKTTAGKNISLVLGANGSGKTEMLFSFQWVLYGFDFKNLREKDETPYSLNSALYHHLKAERNAPSVDCWVELSFTHNGIEYFVKRTETFYKVNDKISSMVKVSLSHTQPNGERTTPETNITTVEGLLSRIIPKSILEGITFDGERMKKLNIADDGSRKVIANVISLVTNEKLFELCRTEIKEVSSDISKERNRINKSAGNTDAETLEEEIEELTEFIEDAEGIIDVTKKNLQKVVSEIEDISNELAQLEEAKLLEMKRRGLEKDVERVKREYDKSIEQFSDRLVDGYFLISDELVQDVKESLDTVDVPAGLTVEAVRSIMKRPKCICGCDMDADIRHRLEALLSTLPPDNISSNILYMANQFQGDKAKAKKLIKEAYDTMREKKDELARLKVELSEIASSLVTNVSGRVKELEQKRSKLEANRGKLEDQIERNERESERKRKRLKEAKKELEEASGNQQRIRELIKQSTVLDRFKEAISKIGERNQALSLVSINSYLTKAYALLSEDTGRRIYLCQFNKKEKFGLLTYLQSRYTEMQTRWLNKGRIKALRDQGLTDEEIHEELVIEVAEGKSTGQSKVNSLAFAKAILQYSNEDRSQDELKVSRDYPFLIDSPFTELSEENQTNVACNIHTFASQVLIMADEVSYGFVAPLVKPAVNTQTRLVKDKEKGVTSIK